MNEDLTDFNNRLKTFTIFLKELLEDLTHQNPETPFLECMQKDLDTLIYLHGILTQKLNPPKVQTQEKK